MTVPRSNTIKLYCPSTSHINRVRLNSGTEYLKVVGVKLVITLIVIENVLVVTLSVAAIVYGVFG